MLNRVPSFSSLVADIGLSRCIVRIPALTFCNVAGGPEWRRCREGEPEGFMRFNDGGPAEFMRCGVGGPVEFILCGVVGPVEFMRSTIGGLPDGYRCSVGTPPDAYLCSCGLLSSKPGVLDRLGLGDHASEMLLKILVSLKPLAERIMGGDAELMLN